MKKLKEESEDAYQKQFSNWDKCLKDNGVSSVEELMGKVFEAVRKNPTKKKSDKKDYKPEFASEDKSVVKTKKGTYKRSVKLTKEQKDANLEQKIKMAKEQIRKLEG